MNALANTFYLGRSRNGNETRNARIFFVLLPLCRVPLLRRLFLVKLVSHFTQAVEHSAPQTIEMVVLELKLSNDLFWTMLMLKMLQAIPKEYVANNHVFESHFSNSSADCHRETIARIINSLRISFAKAERLEHSIAIPHVQTNRPSNPDRLSIDDLQVVGRAAIDGWLFEHSRKGQSAQPSPSEFFEVIFESAQHGCAKAQYILGLIYSDGYGCKQDHAESVQWFTRSAENGNSAAQCTLGYLYVLGYNVQLDLDIGKHWLQKAANNQCHLAGQALYVLSSNTGN